MRRAFWGWVASLLALQLLVTGCALFSDDQIAPPAPSVTPAAPDPVQTESVSQTPEVQLAEGEVGGAEDNTQKPDKPSADENKVPTSQEPEEEATAPAVDSELDAWTILIYMSAGSELDAAALEAVNAMEAAGDSETTNVVVQLDRDRVSEEDDAWRGARRYRIVGDDNAGQINSELLQNLGATNMGDPDTLNDFVLWARGAFPANRYALILWGDSRGWRGIVDDAVDEDDLSMPDLGGALARVQDGADGTALDVIGFDGSLTAHFELLSVVQPYARYAVATPGLLPLAGWDYGGFLEALYAEGDLSAENLARLLATSAIEGPAADSALGVSTTAVDLQQLTGVGAALQMLAQTLQENAEVAVTAVARARYVAQVETLSPTGTGAYDAVDLGRFAAYLAQNAPSRGLSAPAAVLLDALERVVVVSGAGEATESGDGIDGIVLAFPPAATVADAYAAVATPGWREAMQAFHEAYSKQTVMAWGRIDWQGAESAGAQQPVLLGLELRALNVDSAALVGVRQEPEGRERLMYLESLAHEAHWPDGVTQEERIWDATAPYISDGANGDFSPMWPVAHDGDLFMVAAQYVPADGDLARDAILLFDGDSQQLASVWQAGDADVAPRQVLPSTGDSFQLINYYLAEDDQLTSEPGVTLVFTDGVDISYEYFPLPSGEYTLGLLASTATGVRMAARANTAVVNEELTPGYQAYLSPSYGFQFLYPLAWSEPVFDGRRVSTASRQEGPSLTVSVYSENGAFTAAQLKAQTLEAFGDVDVLYEEAVQVAGAEGLLTAYGYEGERGPHTGIFVTLAGIGGDTGYVIDVDGLTLYEADTIEIADRVVESWQFTGVQGGSWPEQWATTEAGPFSVTLPPAYQHRTLDNGWELFRSGPAFLALRSDPISGEGRRDIAAHWMEVAAREVAGFEAGQVEQSAFARTIWSRVPFHYEDDEGTVAGVILATIYGGREVVAWAEAPQDVLDRLLDEEFLYAVASALPDAPGTAGVLFQETFDEAGSWGTGRQEGATGAVAGGRYVLAVDTPRGFFWTAPGVALVDGRFEVETTQMEGSFNGGYGLLLRADAEEQSFYVFEISADGYTWIGRCEQNCAQAETLVGDGWVATEAIRQGLDVTNRLRVEAEGSQLAFFVNDSLVGMVEDGSASAGDVGLFAETSGGERLVVAFDNLLVTAH